VQLASAIWKDKTMVSAALIAQTVRQLYRMLRGADPIGNPTSLWSLLCDRVRRKFLIRHYRR
jgi:hypothetical protein